jgi:hypothetical protein
VSYGALQVQFQLDDALLEILKDEPLHDGRRAPRRGHGESGAGRWYYGPL